MASIDVTILGFESGQVRYYCESLLIIALKFRCF